MIEIEATPPSLLNQVRASDRETFARK